MRGKSEQDVSGAVARRKRGMGHAMLRRGSLMMVFGVNALLFVDRREESWPDIEAWMERA
jgi:hypothetical protein